MIKNSFNNFCRYLQHAPWLKTGIYSNDYMGLKPIMMYLNILNTFPLSSFVK